MEQVLRMNFLKYNRCETSRGEPIARWRYQQIIYFFKRRKFTCKRWTRNGCDGHKKELNAYSSRNFVHTNDVSTKDGKENHKTAVEHTENHHVNNETDIALCQRAQSIGHANNQHGHLKTV